MLSKRIAALSLIFILISSCSRSAEEAELNIPPTNAVPLNDPVQTYLPPTRPPGASILTPTPDLPRILPTMGEQATVQVANPGEYIVQFGDYFGKIAEEFNISIEELSAANPEVNPDYLEVGQILIIPGADKATPFVQLSNGSDFKILPDSELVNGPVSIRFNTEAYVQQRGGYLASYQQDVDGEFLNGAQIVNKVAQNYSVNPRLLLAILEYRSGWVTNPHPDGASFETPIHYVDDFHIGLYRQLTWAANALNFGFYKYQEKSIAAWTFENNTTVAINPGINPGTAAVQNFFAQVEDPSTWQHDVGINGLFATYFLMFGYPFDFAIEPIFPTNMIQPAMQLPFENGDVWSFTGGPHGGWDDGSAWAALDFAPPGGPQGCVLSSAWVVAVADGLIISAENGRVILDLDGDGYEQTGWTVMYLHVDSSERVGAGTYLRAGERIGHPSCEGGFSSASHIHIARRYNGAWVAADGGLPFNLDGWLSSGGAYEYDGFLNRGDVSMEAENGQSEFNQIFR